MTTEPSTASDRLAQVLAAHDAIGYDDVEGCECGAVVSNREAHHAHVAEEIRKHLAAGTVTRWDVEVRVEPDSAWFVTCRGLHSSSAAATHLSHTEQAHAKRVVRVDRTPLLRSA